MAASADAPDSETSPSLLHRARNRDPLAWRRLAELYGPVVYGWARSAGLREHDAADVVQDVFQAVFQSLGRFRQDRPTDRFRDWLWTITRRRAIDHVRQRASVPSGAGGTTAHQRLQELPERLPEESPTGGAQAEVVQRALSLIRPEFTEPTWQACLQTAAQGRRPADVAADLQMSLGAVYVARSRVLKRLRRELDELM